MNNLDVEQVLDECAADLTNVLAIISSVGAASNISPYLTKYSIIKACGTIETSFKAIVADFCSHRCKKQVKRFIEKEVRGSSKNPSYDNICKLLKSFDTQWHTNFKTTIDRTVDKSMLKTSLQSLVDARNEFAHGGNPSASIGDVVQYFSNSRRVIEVLDSIII